MLTYAQQSLSNHLEKLATKMLLIDDKRKTSKLSSKQVKQYKIGYTYILKVPYAEKDQAKALGAKWDYETKTWQCPSNLDAGMFQKFYPTLLTQDVQDNLKSKLPKPVLRYKKMKTTGALEATCDCTVAPWEHCRHTLKF